MKRLLFLCCSVYAGLAVTLSFGCGQQQLIDQLVNGSPAGGEQPSKEDRPEGKVVTVQFRNFASANAVDVQFFATNLPLSLLPDDLFTDELQVTNSVGVAGTGIIEPVSQDVIEFPCTDSLTLGTDGGRFLDNETGELRGVGEQRWVQQGPLALCGLMVTFDFKEDGTTFVTQLKITDRP